MLLCGLALPFLLANCFPSAHGLILPTNTSLASAISSLAQNVSVHDNGTSNIIRRPGFSELIAKGQGLAHQYLGDENMGLIWKIINWTPEALPSTDVNHFLFIDMELKLGPPGSQAWAATLSSKDSRWDTWTAHVNPPSYAIPQKDLRIGFDWSRTQLMSEKTAMEIATAKGRRGPWNVVQLCQDPRAKKRVAVYYAFAYIHELIPGAGLYDWWTAVDIETGTVSIIWGDPCTTNYPADANALNGTLSSGGNASDPLGLT